jgi:hypothetical protein
MVRARTLAIATSMSGTVNEDIDAAKFLPDAIYERLQRFTIH